jgi:HKD family nuclease
MADLTVRLVDQPLEVLNRVAHEYAGMDLELAVAYISPGGVFHLRPLIAAAGQVRAIIGVAPINRVNALRQLQDLGVEVFIYQPAPGAVFHPKIYYGMAKERAWAMIGSSNLTANALNLNIEVNLFIAGKRLAEPFPAIEATLVRFRQEARLLDENLLKLLEAAERRAAKQLREREYSIYLINEGLSPAIPTAATLPREQQELALRTYESYLRETRMVYAYQMLLSLIILSRADQQGRIAQKEAAHCFLRFYRLRDQLGLPREKQRAFRTAIVDQPFLSEAEIIHMIKIDPFPRLERLGLLEISEDEQYYIVNPALIQALSPEVRSRLRALAIRRLARHFGEEEATIEELVIAAIG